MNPVKRTYHEICSQNKLSRFVILFSFIITFIITRIITYLQRIGTIPDVMGMLHIHHMVPGIILILITGYIGISFWEKPRVRIVTALLFGIGAALTIDEFALWLFLKDVYWEREGRISVDAVILVTVLLLLGFLIRDVKRHKNKK